MYACQTEFEYADCRYVFFGHVDPDPWTQDFDTNQDGMIATWLSKGDSSSWEWTYPPGNEHIPPGEKALLKMIFLFPRWDMLIP